MTTLQNVSSFNNNLNLKYCLNAMIGVKSTDNKKITFIFLHILDPNNKVKKQQQHIWSDCCN